MGCVKLFSPWNQDPLRFLRAGDVDGDDSRSEYVDVAGFVDDMEGDGNNDSDAGANVGPWEKLK